MNDVYRIPTWKNGYYIYSAGNKFFNESNAEVKISGFKSVLDSFQRFNKPMEEAEFREKFIKFLESFPKSTRKNVRLKNLNMNIVWEFYDKLDCSLFIDIKYIKVRGRTQVDCIHILNKTYDTVQTIDEVIEDLKN